MKKRIIDFLKKNRLVFASFLLPVFILTLVFAACEIYPFGSQQLAVIDMYHQYIPFLGELQYKLQEGGSLFYTWNSGGGCNFWCLLAYYGASPLNLLLILFPKTLIMEGVTIILLIKIGLTGSFMFIYLKNVRTCADGLVDKRCGWATVAFACTYAMSSYVVGYYWCIMWLDAVMLLPLCILGLTKLISEGKIALYTVTLALIIFANYYIAIMVCIFILVYYPVLYFTTVNSRGARECLITTVKAVACSGLGIAMSSAMLLPTYAAMKDAYYFSSEMPKDWSLYQDALDILNQLLPNAHLTYLDGLPNISCGLIVTMMLVFYYISKEIPFREKALNGAFLIFMFFSLNINKLDFIWHGMHFPNQLPHRFSFVICFVLVGMAYRAFKRINSISLKSITVVCVSGVGYYLIAQKILPDKIDNVQMFLYYGLALIAVYGIVLSIYRRQKITRKAFVLLIIICITSELSVTTCLGFYAIGSSSRITYNENKTSITKLGEYVSQTAGATSDGGDGTFSRVEIDAPLIHNCPAFYHYRGLGQFSSTLNANTTELMEKMGLEGHPGSNRFNYNETSPVTNCITNLNYIIAKNRKLEDGDFDFVKKNEYSGLYKSKYPLSLGYMLPMTIKSWEPVQENPFNNLDKYVEAATAGKIKKVFVNKGKGEVIDNGTYSYYESENNIECRLLEGTNDGAVTIKYEADTKEKYYVYVQTENAKDIIIERGKSVDDIDVQADCGSILNIGELNKGEEFNVKVQFEEGKASRITCYVYTLDYKAWDKAYKLISNNLMTVTNASDRHIEGSINVASDGVLVTSVPYEEGWTMKVDGKKCNINELTGGSWISVSLKKGKHKIELSFTPPKLVIGIVITVLSVIILAFATKLQARLRQRESLEEEFDCSTE